jgi:hypothetical protein
MLGKKTFQKIGFRDIGKGHSYADAVLSGHPSMVAFSGTKLDVLKRYIQMIESGDILHRQNRAILQKIYCGYYYEQLGLSGDEQDKKRQYFENALKNWNEILDKRSIPCDVRYYVLLSTARIMDALDCSWPLIEDICLSAFKIFPQQGEALEPIIRHYFSTHDSAIAYIFSSYAKEQHAFSPPITSNWRREPTFKGWAIVDLHISICESLGLFKEASTILNELTQLNSQNPGLFQEEEVTQLINKSRAFHKKVPV